jgi:N,N'-diacetyllegionaminate synthase
MNTSVKVIAEFCQNHNGDPKILQEMLHQAAEGGASYAKIQTIFAEDLAYRAEFEEGFTENGIVKVIKRPYKLEYERLKKLELSYEQQAAFVRDCERFGIRPLTTAFTRGSVAKIREAGFEHIKVASYDCGSLPLIRDLATNFRELIVSTGATYDEEILRTAEFLREAGTPFSLLHCVTVYPTPLSEMNLRRMAWLRRVCPRVGLSEHTLAERDGVKACLAAIYLGAELIERHFTVLGPSESRDGPVSINPKQLKEIVSFARLSREDQLGVLQEKVPEFSDGTMLGFETRALSESELLNRAYYRGRFATHVKGKPQYNWEEG